MLGAYVGSPADYPHPAGAKRWIFAASSRIVRIRKNTFRALHLTSRAAPLPDVTRHVCWRVLTPVSIPRREGPDRGDISELGPLEIALIRKQFITPREEPLIETTRGLLPLRV